MTAIVAGYHYPHFTDAHTEVKGSHDLTEFTWLGHEAGLKLRFA